MKTTEKIAGEYSIDSTCVTVTSTTNSTSTTTGALVVAGGIGVACDVCIGGNLYATGNTVIGDADTDSVCFTADVISHIIPDETECYNLGSATKIWNCIFVATASACNIDVSNCITTCNINVSNDITVSGKVSLPDGSVSDTYAGFGADDDLKIFHNGTHSIIRETGTGDLYLQSDNNVILSKDTDTEIMVKGIADGAVELYYDNVKKLETSADGVSIDGTITVDGTTNSTSGTTGSIQTDGGLGVACDAYIAGKLTMSNVIQLHTATSDPTGAEGQIYYKSDTCKFRGYADGAWVDLN